MKRLHLPFASPEGEGFCPRKWTMIDDPQRILELGAFVAGIRPVRAAAIVIFAIISFKVFGCYITLLPPAGSVVISAVDADRGRGPAPILLILRLSRYAGRDSI